MAIPELQPALDEFIERTDQIKAIMVGIEEAARNPTVLQTVRPNIDLSQIGMQTSSTVNAMALIFLASSFEEFVREEIRVCTAFMSTRYAKLSNDTKHTIRGLYWKTFKEQMKYMGSFVSKETPKVLDLALLTQIGDAVDSVHEFVGNDNSAKIDPGLMAKHSNNFRPHIVNQVAQRLGISNLMEKAADTTKIKAHFATSKKDDAAKLLKLKLDDFYTKRNEVVHSLTGATGYGVDFILDFVTLFEITAESVRNVLDKEVSAWPV